MSDPHPDSQVLERLFALIEARKDGAVEPSYTAELFAAGIDKIAEKLGEEAIETVIAAVRGDRRQIARESADLLYHLLVLWVESGVAPAEIWAELARREGVSGLAEKASRAQT